MALPPDSCRPTRRKALRCFAAAVCLGAFAGSAAAQVIEYEANGHKYQTATRDGLTVIVTLLPSHVAGFGMVQVSMSNGGTTYRVVRPQDFAFVRNETPLAALPAGQVVDMLLDKATHADVVKLVMSYESALYGIPNMRSTNGYETRRQAAMAYGMPSRLKAAATASAIALSQGRLAPGQSTDGAVFIPLPNNMKALTGGHLVYRSGTETFEFNPE